jgi:hypothetical protein
MSISSIIKDSLISLKRSHNNFGDQVNWKAGVMQHRVLGSIAGIRSSLRVVASFLFYHIEMTEDSHV